MTGGDGGGLACFESDPCVIGCRFIDNTVLPPGRGGGFSSIMSAPRLIDCSFTGNTAAAGGGAFLSMSHASFEGCRFRENSAEMGGGVSCLWSDDLLGGCTFTDNEAGSGGGMSAEGVYHPRIRGCTFYANRAVVAGGILCADANLTITATIVAFCPQGEAVGWILGGQLELSCCDLFGNAGGDWVGPIASQAAVAGNFSADPRFCDPPLGDLRLWNHSPCAQYACGVIGAWPVGCTDPQAVRGEGTAPRPQIVCAAPNPFSTTALISCTIPSELAAAALEIYDAAGRRVRRLALPPAAGGHRTIGWDGCDQGGNPLATGVYHCRLGTAHTRVMLVR